MMQPPDFRYEVSLPGLTRQSINLTTQLGSMDARVKPAHGEQCYFVKCFAKNPMLRGQAMSALALS